MAQPVIDTLQVADALQRSGMEREQAEGVARTLGTQLGEHVAVGKDLDIGFNRISAHVDERFAQHRAHVDERFAQHRAHVDERFAQERAHVDERFARIDQRFAKVDEQFVRIDGRFQALDERFKALDGKLNLLLVGAGLALAYLAVIATLDRFV
ncbi:MAG: hypothetical protein F4X36_10490 [Gammaproteobacteria bacterium]|nr:hypothetical protein [Gammaproteobacteria bacterium]